MKTLNQVDWAYQINGSGFVTSEECKEWQHGGPSGVRRILNRCHKGVELSDGEHGVAFEIHTNYNRWAKRYIRAKLSYPPDLQAQRDAMIRRNREKR